jgi:hypothetical protein
MKIKLKTQIEIHGRMNLQKNSKPNLKCRNEILELIFFDQILTPVPIELIFIGNNTISQ